MRLVFVIGLVLVLSLSATEDQPASAAEKLASLQQANKAAEVVLKKSIEELPDNLAKNRKALDLWKEFERAQAERFEQAMELARQQPQSETAFAALDWVFSNAQTFFRPLGKESLLLLAEHHAGHPNLDRILAGLTFLLPNGPQDPNLAAHDAFLKAVSEKNRNGSVQAHLAYHWAMQAYGRYAAAEYKKSADVDKLAAEAIRDLEAVLNKHGQVVYPFRWSESKLTLGIQTGRYLRELRYLRVGLVAPDLVGEDLDGKPLKLSDHRGKVVVLAFWATWCGPCMRMVPEERKLVERLKDKPFVLLGVNGDADRAKARKAAQDKMMTWRSFWDEAGGKENTISSAWNVQAWLTVYVLDAKGVIRYKFYAGDELENAAETLLAEMKKAD